MEIVWTSTVFTLIAAAIVILIICGVILLIIGVKRSKKQARIED